MDLETIGEAAKEAKEFIGKLVNPGLEELGELFADQIKLWRYKNLVNITIRAKRFLDKKGIDPQRIPLKTLYPILEYCSLEEDENLKDKWAALLANVADPGYQMNIEVVFIDILRQLSPLEAFILDSLYAKHSSELLFTEAIISEFSGIPEKQYDVIIGNLFRLNLLQPYTSQDGFLSIEDVEGEFPFALQTTKILEFTKLGLTFMEYCRFAE